MSYSHHMKRTLKRLTYRPELVAAARFLRISGTLKEIYGWLARPRNGIYKARLGEVEALFLVSSAGELRRMEGTYTGGEEIFLKSLLSLLRPGDVFYDVGGNIGEYSVFAAKVVGDGGSVFAFEPEPTNYESIEAHLKLNQLRNVRAFNVALGEQCGVMTLNVRGFQNTQCQLTLSEPEPGVQTKRVKVVSGDEIREAEELPVPNAVKIDVEGFEYSVLKGLRTSLMSPDCRLILCEIHPSRLPNGVNPEAVIELIKSMGFSFVETFRRGSELHLICSKQRVANA